MLIRFMYFFSHTSASIKRQYHVSLRLNNNAWLQWNVLRCFPMLNTRARKKKATDNVADKYMAAGGQGRPGQIITILPI